MARLNPFRVRHQNPGHLSGPSSVGIINPPTEQGYTPLGQTIELTQDNSSPHLTLRPQPENRDSGCPDYDLFPPGSTTGNDRRPRVPRFAPHCHKDPARVSGSATPIPGLNPTRIHLQTFTDGSGDKFQLPNGFTYKWTTRNNRKGRHALVFNRDKVNDIRVRYPESTSSRKVVYRRLRDLFTTFPYWDISFLIAFMFLIGSIAWVINGAFSLIRFWRPSTPKALARFGGGITAFIGSTLYELRALLLMIELFNEGRSGCFGWAVLTCFPHQCSSINDAHSRAEIKFAKAGRCRHHHSNVRSLVGNDAPGPNHGHGLDGQAEASNQHEMQEAGQHHQDPRDAPWVWFPNRNEFVTHYLKEISFWACAIQVLCSTTFYVSGFASLPPVDMKLSDAASKWSFWFPQVFASSGFVLASILFTVETQNHWYLPAPRILGWWVGFFGLVRSIEFLVCGSIGFAGKPNDRSVSLNSFWGSVAFLMSALFQWYESINKHPVNAQRKTWKKFWESVKDCFQGGPDMCEACFEA